jgi:hypothetical protein
MVRRLGLLFTLLAAVFCVAVFWQLFQTKQAMERGDIEAELREAMGLVDLPHTLGDQVFETLGLEWAGIEKSPEPWGFEDGDGEYLAEPMTPEEAQETLRPARKLQKFFLERMSAGLETPGLAPILNGEPNLRQHRGITSRLAGNMLSMLVVGKADQALLLYRTCHLHARLLARGYRGHPELIASMVAVAQQRTIDKAVAHGLELGLWPPEAMPELAAAIREASEKTGDLDRAVTSELDRIGKVVEIVDRRLGPAGWLAGLYWGDGQAQLATIRAAWKAGKPLPEEVLTGRCHIMVQIGVPNWTAAAKRHEEVLEERRQLLARVEGAAGNQPGASP